MDERTVREVIIDLRPDNPDLDVCARGDCELPRFAHPLNLTDRGALDHYFTVKGEVHATQGT